MLFKLQFDIQFDVFVINVSGTNYFLFHLLEKQHFSKNKSMRQRVNINKGKTEFGIDFLEQKLRFFAIRSRFYTPSPRIFYLKKQLSAQTMLFSWENFYFLKNTL